MALDFTTGVLDSRVTIARALNTATRVNSSGIIENINANLPRFDYDPVTFAAKGLLIEEQRTNLVTYSQTLSDANWNASGATKTSTNNADPAGTTTALLLTANGASSTHFISASIFNVISFVSGTTYTASYFVKPGTATRIQISLPSAAFGASQYANFLLTGNGSVSASSGGTATIAPSFNGYYRITWTATATGTIGASSGALVFITSGTDTRLPTNTSSENIFIWGGQVEVGAFATSYIPTVATSLTRNADVVSMTGTNFSSWYTTAGTNESWFSQFISANIKAGDRLLAFDTGFAGGSAYRTPMSNAFSQLGLYDGTAERTFGAMPLTGVNKAATAYSGVTCSGTLNGAVPTSRTFDGNMNPSTVFGIGSYSGTASGFINGWMQKVAYYPLRLSDAELRAITK
jgi:hypothetical protein